MDYPNYTNKLTGVLHIDPAGSDTTNFGVYSTGTVKKYAYGTRYDIDERSFVYCNAGAACQSGYGCYHYPAYTSIATATAQSIGDTTIDITVTTTAYAVDELQGGYYNQPDSTLPQFRRIQGNTVCASGGITKLSLDGPFTKTMAVNAFAEMMLNPYSDVRRLTYGEYASHFGVPSTTIASGSKGWVQTWGPCWVTPRAPVGDTANWRTVVFFNDGTVNGFDDATAEAGHMVAGYVIDRTGSGSDNPPFIFLTCNK